MINLDQASYKAAKHALESTPGLKRNECEKLSGKYLQTLGRNGVCALFLLLRADGPRPVGKSGQPPDTGGAEHLAESIAAQSFALLQSAGFLTGVVLPELDQSAAASEMRTALVDRSRERIAAVEKLGEDLENLLLAKSLLESMLTYLRYLGKTLPKD